MFKDKILYQKIDAVSIQPGKSSQSICILKVRAGRKFCIYVNNCLLKNAKNQPMQAFSASVET